MTWTKYIGQSNIWVVEYSTSWVRYKNQSTIWLNLSSGDTRVGNAKHMKIVFVIFIIHSSVVQHFLYLHFSGFALTHLFWISSLFFFSRFLILPECRSCRQRRGELKIFQGQIINFPSTHPPTTRDAKVCGYGEV